MRDELEESGPIDWEAGGIETELGWSLSVTLQSFAAAGVVALAHVPGGPRGYQVLVAITTEAPTSQLLLGQRLGIEKNAMTSVIDDLEAAGYVQRRQDARDRRIRQVLPTPSTHALLAAARAALDGVEQAILQPLSPNEQTQLRRLLARVALGVGDVQASPASVADNTNTPAAQPHRSDRRKQINTSTQNSLEKKTQL